MRYHLLSALCLCLTAGIPSAAWAWSVDGVLPGADRERVQAQRESFVEAGRALDDGDLNRFRRLAAGLHEYPLYPYLQFDFLRRHMAHAPASDVRDFLEGYGDTPLAARLRRSWLYHLARRGSWESYLEDYRADIAGTELQCHHATALLRTGRLEQLWPEVERLWLVGVSQPDACDTVFDAWRERRLMTRERVMDRIGLAMERGQTGLVSYLAKFLDDGERHWVRRWQRMYRNERRELSRLSPDDSAPQWSARLFSYGVRRLARHDAAAAARHWRELLDRFPVTRQQREKTERAIGLELAYQRDDAAAQWLGALPDGVRDAKARQWRVRAALWQRDWPRVLKGLDLLAADQQRDEEWRYWRARALEALGREREAEVLYVELAECRCYYGFLAAERAEHTPAIDTAPLDIPVTELAAMAQRPALVRARELHALERITDARREWRDAIARMDADELRTAAKLAALWGWHDQAILTLGRTDTLDDLELRFPTPFQEQVSAAADRRELNIAFIYAVMRQESAFNAFARSSAGALGLMQLMPSTARRTARQIKHRVSGVYDILTVDNNIMLGTAHLRHLLNRYDGNVVYTMAAYNAGPNRVTRWRPKRGVVPADIWIASVPYRETRRYIQRILAYTRIYEWRLGRDLTPMSRYLEALSPADAEPLAGAPRDAARG